MELLVIALATGAASIVVAVVTTRSTKSLAIAAPYGEIASRLAVVEKRSDEMLTSLTEAREELLAASAALAEMGGNVRYLAEVISWIDTGHSPPPPDIPRSVRKWIQDVLREEAA